MHYAFYRKVISEDLFSLEWSPKVAPVSQSFYTEELSLDSGVAVINTEHVAKNLPIIDMKEISGSYVLLDCPLSQVQDYFREKGACLEAYWLQAQISFGVGIKYSREYDKYYYRKFSETDVLWCDAMSRERIVEPQQLVFR